MKHIAEIPEYICPSTHTNYVAYSDTDSIYVHAEPLLRHLHPNFDEMDDKEKDQKLEEVAIEYQNIITDFYGSFSKECFNRQGKNWLEMKTEAVIRSAYFRASRRYAQWITKQEGIVKDVLDIKGLEFKKTNFPPILGEFVEKTLISILKGANESEVNNKIFEFRKKIINGDIPLLELGNPTSVKTLNKYTERNARAGEMFSTVKKGAPAPVKASIVYNDLLKFWKLDKKHSLITQGEKIKWIWLKPNPYQIDALAFLNYDIPEKVNTFIQKFADREKIFTSILLNKLEGMYEDLEWDFNLNKYKNKFFNL
jgi:hypothetical protein